MKKGKKTEFNKQTGLAKVMSPAKPRRRETLGTEETRECGFPGVHSQKTNVKVSWSADSGTKFTF